MASGREIITATKRLGGGPPMKEYFLVAIADRDEAVKALRERRQLLDVQITVAGQATDEYLEWLDVRPGEIFCVMAVGCPSPANAPATPVASENSIRWTRAMLVRLRQEVQALPWRAGNVALNRAPDLATAPRADSG